MTLGYKQRPLSAQRGSALLAALCFATVLGLSVASYLALSYQSLTISSRGMQSMRSIELAETGFEDALWALNKNDWSGWSLSSGIARKTLSGFTYDNGVTGSVALTVNSYDGSLGARTVTADSTMTLARWDQHQPHAQFVGRIRAPLYELHGRRRLHRRGEFLLRWR